MKLTKKKKFKTDKIYKSKYKKIPILNLNHLNQNFSKNFQNCFHLQNF